MATEASYMGTSPIAAQPTSAGEGMVETVKRWAQTCFAEATHSHDWEHTLRVLRLGERIGRAHDADMSILRIAACLHDIGRAHQDASNGRICHAVKGVEMARPLLEGLGLTVERRQNVLHCIAAHRFRTGPSPSTLEAKVLFDADKLDAIGAVGIARAYLFAGEVGARLHNADGQVHRSSAYSKDDTGFREYTLKLSKVKDRMLTTEGRKMAVERHAFMVAFFDRFLAEHQGIL